MFYEFKLNTLCEKLDRLLVELDKKNEAIIDISVYPELIKMRGKNDLYPTYYFPDTIKKLILQEEKYKEFLQRLIRKWTKRYVDFELLKNIFIKEGIPWARIKVITKDMVDEEVYSFCYEKFTLKELEISFSPKFNLLGDLIGKILGFAKKSGIPILMRNQTLVRFVKKSIIGVFGFNIFVDKKQEILEKYIPLRKTRFIRWLIGVAIQVNKFETPLLSRLKDFLGIVLILMDP